MGVAGAPERTKNHAELIMDMALDMRDVVQFVKDPRPGSDGHIKIRLGSHSGQVCLFVISVCVVLQHVVRGVSNLKIKGWLV